MIKNYTSTVPVERTILRIELALITGGATGIGKDYKDGHLQAIYFSVPSKEKRLLGVRLPANVEAVYQVFLSKLKRKPTQETLKRARAQAERTAWKLIQDWVAIQMAMIKMEQAELLQVFLPYILRGDKTLYEAVKEENFKLLMEWKGD